MAQKKNSRQKGNSRKRERILDAAIFEVAQHGYYKTTISTIARRAGVADGTIYLYFRNKAEILVSIFDRAMIRFIEAGKQELARVQGAEARLRRIVELHLSLVGENRDLAVIFQVELRHSLHFMGQFSRSRIREYLGIIADVIRHGQEEEKFRQNLDPLLAAKAVFGVLDEMATDWVLSHRNTRLTAKSDEVADLVIGGLRTDLVLEGVRMAQPVHPERIHILKEKVGDFGPTAGGAAARRDGPIVYWMSRDQRMRDNWALLYAQQLARQQSIPLAVVFCLVPRYLGASRRAYDFMISGLRQVEVDLATKRIPFFLLTGDPDQVIPAFVKKHRAQTLVCDFSPLRLVRGWQEQVASKLDIACHEVDAHNVMPCRTISDKQEYAARTIRPKLQRRLREFLAGFPRLQPPPQPWTSAAPRNNWDTAVSSIVATTGPPPITWLKAGERAARRMMRQFIAQRLQRYDAGRNDPNADAQSQLSPYLHFGQISAQRVALEVLKAGGDRESQEVFLEELLVRRELSDNFCHYNSAYDDYEGFPAWARRTLEDHADDKRDYLYSQDDFEQARTHDALWNAAQLEMVLTGKMHGYLRMYWAKKILEWTADPETALSIANHLNDTYELDGRDPNGYTGTAWSIGGVHDRSWFERPVFGKIRYMNANGCKRKFDVARYINRMRQVKRERTA